MSVMHKSYKTLNQKMYFSFGVHFDEDIVHLQKMFKNFMYVINVFLVGEINYRSRRNNVLESRSLHRLTVN